MLNDLRCGAMSNSEVASFRSKALNILELCWLIGVVILMVLVAPFWMLFDPRNWPVIIWGAIKGVCKAVVFVFGLLGLLCRVLGLLAFDVMGIVILYPLFLTWRGGKLANRHLLGRECVPVRSVDCRRALAHLTSLFRIVLKLC